MASGSTIVLKRLDNQKNVERPFIRETTDRWWPMTGSWPGYANPSLSGSKVTHNDSTPGDRVYGHTKFRFSKAEY